MAQTIKIKRSTTTAAPSSLAQGELAYSDISSKLFVGSATDGTILTIGGKLYVDMLDHTAGILTASSAIVVDSNSKIDKLLTGNIRINNNTNHIDTSSGDLTLNPASNLVLTTGTVDLSGQATEFKLIDNSGTALTISEGSNNYITLDTTNSAERVKFSQQVEFSGAYTLPTSDGSTGQALITDGSGAVAFTTISTELDIAGDSGTDTVSLISDTLTFSAGTGLSTAVTNNTVTINAATITLGSSTLTLGATTASIAGLEQLDVDNVRVDTNTISTTNSNGNLILSPNGSGTVTVPSGYKDRVGFGATSLVSKEYVDAIKQALDVKESVTVATTANLSATYNNSGGTLTNSGSNAALQLDGITVTAGNRVLVKNQSTAAENGIYVVTTAGDGSTAWVLTRSEDTNTGAKLTGGTFTFVETGDTNADNGYVFTHNGAPTLGTTSLPVSQFSGAGQISPGDGLSKLGNTLNVNDDNISIEINSDNVRIKGVTSTAAGDLIYGVATNGGFSSLVKPAAGTVTASDFLLSMDTSGVPTWANVLDGGTY